MGEAAQVTEQFTSDMGIEEGCRRLTPARIETVVKRILETEAGARMKVYVDTCVHCGLCSEACHFYKSHDGDPKYSPAGKVKQTLRPLIKKKGRVDVDFIRRATRERFRQLFDEVPCYISVQDRNLRITAANKRFKADFGDDSGAFCFEIYKHRSDACPQCPVTQTFQDGRSHSHETVVRTRAGEEYHMLVLTSPIRDENGLVTQVMEMSTNITEVRRLQDHLSSLGLLIGSASHGIKGLLTGLDGGMYLVDSGIARDNQVQVKEGWETVRLMVERIRNMMIDILFYAKEKDLKWQRVDIASFAEETAAAVAPEMKADGVELVRAFGPDLSEVRLDVGVVRAALMNILENARYACKTDAVPKAHRVVFRVLQVPDKIIFSVEDNGAGMDEKTLSRLFKTVLSSKGRKGTGLGLFISGKIIEQNGGRLSAVSTLGEGSTFTIEIPKTPVLQMASRQQFTGIGV